MSFFLFYLLLFKSLLCNLLFFLTYFYLFYDWLYSNIWRFFLSCPIKNLFQILLRVVLLPNTWIILSYIIYFRKNIESVHTVILISGNARTANRSIDCDFKDVSDRINELKILREIAFDQI